MSSPESLDWDLLNELECPVCVEYMASPIKMCENGHNICSSCKSRVSVCPTCKGEFITARNITLEKITAIAIYPCKNREAGCAETFTVQDKTTHQTECLYQRTECPFTKLSRVNCLWSGILFEIGGHVRSEHDSETSEHTGCFAVTLQNFSTAKRYRKAMFICENLFYLVWEVSFDTFYFSVFHVGHMNEAENFIYEFKICKLRENISITGTCRSYLEAKWKVLRPGECVTLHYRTVQKYVSQSAELSCEIEIRKKSFIELNDPARQHYVAVATAVADACEYDWYE
jgi:E3 ubiquitin-protein ligase SIAH1